MPSYSLPIGSRASTSSQAAGPRWSLSWLVVALLQMSLATWTSRADNGWEKQIFSLYLENDAIAGSDRHYTQGANVAYQTRDDDFPKWIKTFSSHIPSPGLEVGAQKLGFALGQEIYTPEDLRSATLDKDDRPYAGWLFGSVSLQRRGPGYRDWPVRETLRIDLGMIGPESLAEDTQKTWHGLDPKGWDFQLRSEPGVVLRYQREYLFSVARPWPAWRLDLIPYIAADLGNVASGARLGSQLRFGYNVPNQFETKPTDDSFKWGGYFFGGLDGHYVGRNVFLDGNTFRSSHHVDAIPWVGSFRVGMTFVLKQVELSVAHTFLTEEFEGQKSRDSFSTASLTVKF